MSHRRLFSIATNHETAMHLLALDPRNPRSILYQLNEIRDHVTAIADGDEADLRPLDKKALQLQTDLRLKEPDDLTPQALADLGAEIGALAALVSATHLR